MKKSTYQSEIETLQLLIARKKREYETGLRSSKDFESVKCIYEQIKELENSLQSLVEKAKQEGQYI